MFDVMFAFIDPIVELNEEGASFVIQAETFFEFLEKAGLDDVLYWRKEERLTGIGKH
jgi:hypothetical protein